MGLFDKLRGEFVDIVEWIDDSRHTLVWRFPRYHNQIKNGAQLNCPVEIAAGVARTCHLGNVAYKTGRRLYWDAENSKFINDAEADPYLTPTYREPWTLPKL